MNRRDPNVSAVPTLQNPSTPSSGLSTGQSAPPLNLPDIDDLSAADVVIYDGQCNFCRAQVQRLNWFAAGRLAFVSLHDPRVAERFPQLSPEQLMQQMYVVSPTGEHHAGAAAVRYLSRRLPRLWFVAPFLHIPFSLPLWQAGYDWVARNRYRIAGRSVTCDNDACRTHFDR